jgi:bromodomain adjacent to zinc finger domain protein 1A
MRQLLRGMTAEMEALEARRAEEERRRKRPFKVPTEGELYRNQTRESQADITDLLIEYSADRDGLAGRIAARPAPSKELPFGEQFEQFLMTWSFLNVMG